jgi:hypothetical protein
MNSVYAVVAQLHVTANCIKIMNIAQQGFYGKCHQKQCKLYVPMFENNVTTNVYSFHMLHLNAALKHKNVLLLMALLRHTIWLHRS